MYSRALVHRRPLMLYGSTSTYQARAVTRVYSMIYADPETACRLGIDAKILPPCPKSARCFWLSTGRGLHARGYPHVMYTSDASLCATVLLLRIHWIVLQCFTIDKSFYTSPEQQTESGGIGIVGLAGCTIVHVVSSVRRVARPF